jgi:hypothetical protein
MNMALFIGIVILFAILFFHEFFFGEKKTDDRRGFPCSRNRRKK